MMRSSAALGATLLACLATAVPALAADADISVTQSAHKGNTLWPVGPPHVGDITIGRQVTFAFQVENHGPDAATVTFRSRITPYEDTSPSYDNWTIPAKVTTFAQSGEPIPTCNWDILRCTAQLGSGREASFLIAVRGNAPGPFEISAAVSTGANDPDLSNNTTVPFSERVVCTIVGTPGDDVLEGTPQPDSICGGGGDDVLRAVGKRDRLYGGRGNDRFVAAPGEQTYVGGRGSDTISYAAAPRGVQVSLADRGGSGWGFDTLSGLEGVIGSRFADYLEGSARADVLVGRRGADELFGRGGRDTLAGGVGADQFISRDRAVDLLRGGAGGDDGYVDPNDRRASVRSIAWIPFADRKIRPKND